MGNPRTNTRTQEAMASPEKGSTAAGREDVCTTGSCGYTGIADTAIMSVETSGTISS
jgi:hypothetical protein